LGRAHRYGRAAPAAQVNRLTLECALEIDELAPLFGLAGIRWLSPQAGSRVGDFTRLPGGHVVDLSGELTDFAETAAAIRNLDYPGRLRSMCGSGETKKPQRVDILLARCPLQAAKGRREQAAAPVSRPLWWDD
jgi:hypothetical protein